MIKRKGECGVIRRLLATGICCMMLLVQPVAGAAGSRQAVADPGTGSFLPVAGASGAVHVADDARATAEVMQTQARERADQARAKADIAEAEAEAARAAVAVAQAEAEQAAAEAAMAAAEAAAAKAEAKAAEADTAQAAAQAEYTAAKAAAEKAAVAAAKAAEAEAVEAKAAEAAAAAAAANAAAEAAALAEADEAKTDEAVARAEAAADKAYAEAEARSVAAERRANEAAAALEAAEARVAAAETKLDSSNDARAEADDAKAGLADARANLADAQATLAEAKRDLHEANTAVADARQQARPIQERRSFQWENRYYSYRDRFHNSGYQFVQPYEFSYLGDRFGIGLSTNYIISSAKSINSNGQVNQSGRVATWSDTTLSLIRENPKPLYTVRYMLDINMPTGKASLHGSQVNAVMSEHFVGFSRYGEGWNYTPGIAISRKTGPEDTWTLGTLYSFRGKYTPDDSTGNITPGDEWIKFLRWQHIGQKWQLAGELMHISYGSTLEPFNTVLQPGGVTYRQGSETAAKLTYTRALTSNHNLMLYYWHSTQQAYSSPNPAAAGLEGTGTVQDQFFGAQWSVDWKDKYTFRVYTDMMRESGASFSPLTNIFMGGGSKYSIGLGYDVDIRPQRRISLDIARFYMRENAIAGSAPLNGLHGYEVYLRYFYNW